MIAGTANALAASTMQASPVTPKTAETESTANSTSVPAIAMKTDATQIALF